MLYLERKLLSSLDNPIRDDWNRDCDIKLDKKKKRKKVEKNKDDFIYFIGTYTWDWEVFFSGFPSGSQLELWLFSGAESDFSTDSSCCFFAFAYFFARNTFITSATTRNKSF